MLRCMHHEEPDFTIDADSCPRSQPFVRVARHGSFTAAAALAVSPSAVSQTIRQLETRLGVLPAATDHAQRRPDRSGCGAAGTGGAGAGRNRRGDRRARRAQARHAGRHAARCMTSSGDRCR
ncbi:helix-turn-helix domain-containing protein [Cupriavidus basilensis]